MNQQSFEVRYQSLCDSGRAVTFPCDAHGHVDLDALPPRLLESYLFTRAMVGRDFLCPCVNLASALCDHAGAAA